jgi:hypothetical protein
VFPLVTGLRPLPGTAAGRVLLCLTPMREFAVNSKNLLITAAVALAVVIGVRMYEQRKAG